MDRRPLLEDFAVLRKLPTAIDGRNVDVRLTLELICARALVLEPRRAAGDRRTRRAVQLFECSGLAAPDAIGELKARTCRA